MKKTWYLSLALLFFTGCQKHELSDLELVKIAREYMSVMNPGEVEKASAYVMPLPDFYYNYSKRKSVGCRKVIFDVWENLPNNQGAWNQWRVSIEEGKAFEAKFVPYYTLEQERKQREQELQQTTNKITPPVKDRPTK